MVFVSYRIDAGHSVLFSPFPVGSWPVVLVFPGKEDTAGCSGGSTWRLFSSSSFFCTSRCSFSKPSSRVMGNVRFLTDHALPPSCFWRRAECRTIRPPRDGATSFLVRSGSSPAVQGFPGKGSSAGSEWGLLLASRFFFSFSFSYVLLF